MRSRIIDRIKCHGGRIGPVLMFDQSHPNPSRVFLKLIKHQRSEEHTSELQSRGHVVCRLLLEKKNWHHQRASFASPAADTPPRQAVVGCSPSASATVVSPSDTSLSAAAFPYTTLFRSIIDRIKCHGGRIGPVLMFDQSHPNPSRVFLKLIKHQ